MQSILTDFDPTTLRQAIKANWADYYTYFARSPKVELHTDSPLTWMLTSVPDSFVNVVFRTQLPADRTSDVIDEALDHFRSKKVTHLGWWVEEDAQQANRQKQLIDHGLTFSEGATGMAVDLTALHEDQPVPANLQIVHVEDRETLQRWIHIARVGFSVPEWGEGRWCDVFADLGFELPIRSYLALLNGQLVGTSQLFLSAGVAGIYNVTCLPEARGQGVGGAITLAPLIEARQMGYRISILQASRLGARVYRRLGFQEYGRLNNYLWVNEAQT